MEAGPWSPTETTVDAAIVTQAAAILRQSVQPVAIVGSQAVLQATRAPRLAQALEQIGLPLYLTGMARGLMGRDHALAMRHQRRQALKDADTVLIAGMPCDFRLDYGRAINRKATVIGINRSRRDLKLNRTPQLAVAADPGRILPKGTMGSLVGNPMPAGNGARKGHPGPGRPGGGGNQSPPFPENPG